jgi:hypothetical protein
MSNDCHKEFLPFVFMFGGAYIIPHKEGKLLLF